jgi:2-hydroxychromene-2-carboxylate isomerase
MAREISFYFDYMSPFAYLAWFRLPELCAKRDVEITPKPVLYAALLDHWGQLGPGEIPPKGLHNMKHCARLAVLANIPINVPRYMPFNPLTALRVSLAVVSGAEQTRVIDTIFKSGWCHGSDLGDKATIATALNSVGLDGDGLVARTEDPAVKQTLREETERAIEKGVFGVPSMVVDKELFWGVDQLPFVGMYLDGEDPLDSIDIDVNHHQGPSARRPGSVGRGPSQDNSPGNPQ